MAGQLVVVGTGIRVGQLTSEAEGWISSADRVLYCVADAATERLIKQISPTAESLFTYYGEGKARKETYEQMVARTLECLADGVTVCVAYYGHPGFFVYPSHKAIELAKAQGHQAVMLPGLSSFDCLICDLGIDVSGGCQMFEATDLMLRRRRLDPSCHTILFQVSALGDMTYSFKGYDMRNLPSLAEHLSDIYPGDFMVKAYHASHFSVVPSIIKEIPIDELSKERTAIISTLYIPPLRKLPIHLEMLEQYDMSYLLDGTRLVPLNADVDTLLVD